MKKVIIADYSVDLDKNLMNLIEFLREAWIFPRGIKVLKDTLYGEYKFGNVVVLDLLNEYSMLVVKGINLISELIYTDGGAS